MRRQIENGTVKKTGIILTGVIMSLLLIAGCATTSGTQRNRAAVVTMVQVEEDIQLLLLELSATNSSLASLINPLQDDLETAYADFSDGTDSLEVAADNFITQSRLMGAQGREYFAEWRIQDNTYANPQIRELSEQNRSELSLLYARIAESSVGIEGDLTEYVSNAKEVDIYFSQDLNARSIIAISTIVNRTILDGSRLSMKLRELLRTVEIARVNLSPLDTGTTIQ